MFNIIKGALSIVSLVTGWGAGIRASHLALIGAGFILRGLISSGKPQKPLLLEQQRPPRNVIDVSFKSVDSVDTENFKSILDASSKLQSPKALPSPPAPRASLTEVDGKNGAKTVGEKKSPGRPPKTDPEKDQKIAETWATKVYKTYAKLAAALGLDKKEAKQACDRYRKRQAKLKNNPIG